MRRKLIKHGLSSLTVTLPKNWVDENNLSKGEEVEINKTGDGLIVSTEKRHEEKSIAVNVSGAEPMIRRIIGATFKSGYDRVIIKFSTGSELEAVQNLVREQFSGFEIVKQTKNKIVIKNVSGTSFDDFDRMLKRLFFILNHMGSEFSKALEKNDYNWLKNIASMKVESDKCADYCRRAINMGFETDLRKPPLYTLVEQLEKTVDRYAELCNFIAKEKPKSSKELKSFVKELVQFQKSLENIFYNYKTEKLIDFGQQEQELQNQLDKLPAEAKTIRLLDRILNILFNLNGPLMAVHI